MARFWLTGAAEVRAAKIAARARVLDRMAILKYVILKILTVQNSSLVDLEVGAVYTQIWWLRRSAVGIDRAIRKRSLAAEIA
jgi:hypothetical protein